MKYLQECSAQDDVVIYPIMTFSGDSQDVSHIPAIGIRFVFSRETCLKELVNPILGFPRKLGSKVRISGLCHPNISHL